MALFRRRANGRGASEDETTLFFATDLHGSEVCFRKFVAAASFYGAGLLVLGGDLTGKLVVPLVQDRDGTWWAEVHGERRTLRPRELDEFEAVMADEGSYTQRMTAEEHAGYERSPETVDALFRGLMTARLEHWIDHARERLAGTGVRIVTAPGNDDPYEVDDVIRERGGDRVLLLEGEVLQVAPGHEMLSTGWSNHTPWHTHREFAEDAIRAHLEAMAARLNDPAAAIFNVHVPPYDSTLDTAPQLDEQLTVRTSLGNPLTGPAGSTAVREAIEAHQPLLSLHGHIHESGGSVRIGRTVAINAGSEYGEGILHGALITVGAGELKRFQATTG
jgi:Icc-related predicted phosphoesterase